MLVDEAGSEKDQKISASKRCRAAKAVGRKQARKSFLAGEEWSKGTLGTVNKEMFCLLCVGAKLGIADTCTHCSACPGGSCPCR